MSGERAFSLLMFLGYLKAGNMLDEEWLREVKKGKWLKTSQGYSAPMISILMPSDIEAQAVLGITVKTWEASGKNPTLETKRREESLIIEYMETPKMAQAILV